MLSPDLRTTLLDGLRPEPDERLEAAVATTFTLDLIAALFPPLAFASFALRDPSDPVSAMEAVRGCNRFVDVFCQAGQIAVPTSVSDLVAFLEPMIHEVRQPRPGRLFHPKVWLVKFRSPAGPRYRLLCMTRNLTGDDSWDAVLRLDGTPALRTVPANEQLSSLIRSLPRLALHDLPPARLARIDGLADEVRTIEWERPAGVDEVIFHVYGAPGISGRADFSGSRHLVISPFCTDDGLARTAPSQSRTVLARQEQLDRLLPATLATQSSYVLNGAAGLHASEGADDPGILNGLHAKVYVIERGSTAHLLIGSANATEAAFDGNVEVLVELIGKPGELGVEAVLGPRDRDEDGSARDRREQSLRDLLEPYDPPGGEPADPAEDEQWRLEQALRDIAQVGFTMTVTAIGTDYDLTAEPAASLGVPLGTRLSVELITRPGEASWYERGTIGPAMFKGVPLSGVTPFLVLRAVVGDGLSRGCVVQAHMIGDPPGRHDEIMARQIDTTEKFLRFVAALLGLTSGPSALLGVPGLASGPTSGSWGTTGLFELLVRSLADRPEALADLDRLVERLAATERGASILPDGFTELWQTIVGALEAVRGGAKAADH